LSNSSPNQTTWTLKCKNLKFHRPKIWIQLKTCSWTSICQIHHNIQNQTTSTLTLKCKTLKFHRHRIWIQLKNWTWTWICEIHHTMNQLYTSQCWTQIWKPSCDEIENRDGNDTYGADVNICLNDTRESAVFQLTWVL
jgi:hypothetical protein